MILMCLRMSSSYPIDTPCVEREDEDFLFLGGTCPAKSPSASGYLVSFAPGANLLLGNKKSFRPQTGGSIYLSMGWVNYGER